LPQEEVLKKKACREENYLTEWFVPMGVRGKNEKTIDNGPGGVGGAPFTKRIRKEGLAQGRGGVRIWESL